MTRRTPSEGGDAAPAADPAALGPAPAVAGRERIRAAARAKLFGTPASADERADELAARSGTIVSRDVHAAHDAGEVGAHALPDHLGRFEVLARLGRGGMGEVYEAYDPELDRKVALKVLRTELRTESSTDAGPARLLREAQAMARLIDPHVITVHDVGTFGDQVFVAMELVDGQTLRQWLQGRPPWAEVLAVFVRAGSGLAAAHRAGLVHRDFKPDNVLMGRDGRVRVVDFGLARAIASDQADGPVDASIMVTRDEGPSSDSRPPERGPDPLHTPLTRSGAVMGTPAYMSPEQHMGRTADARSDQFSFCVALWEGLYGQRPFVAGSYAELVHKVLSGRVEPPPQGSGVPRWIQRVLERGLAVDPAERHASMEDLLAALGRRASPTWRRLGMVLGVGLVGAAAWRFAAVEPSTLAACGAVEERLQTVWGDERREAVRTTLERAGPAGPRIWATTARMLDEYAREWVDASTESCAARLVADRGEDPVLVRRDACLETRLVEMDELVGMLTTADAGLALEAVQAVATLSSVQGCADARRLQAWRAPVDAAARERLGRTRAQLAMAKARGLLGRYEDAMALAQEVIDAARELDDPSTEAAGLLVRGQYEERAGRSDAEQTIREAVRRAEVAGDHATRAHALIQLVWLVGQEAKRYDEARGLGTEARVVLEVLGGAPMLEARLDNNLGVAAKLARDDEAALASYQRALSTQLELFGEQHPETARTLANIGSVLSSRGEHVEAEAMLRRALASFEAVLGDEHPLVAIVVGNLGQNLDGQKRTAEAIPLFERSLSIRQANFEVTHPSIAKSHFNLGVVLNAAKQHDRALEHFEAGLELRARAVGENDPTLHPWWTALGITNLSLARFDVAHRWFERSLAVRSQEEEHELAQLRFDAARALVYSDPNGAREQVSRAIAALEARPSLGSRDEQLAIMRAWLQDH